MSRVHIGYLLKEEKNSKSIWDVISPDFSATGTQRENIGELCICHNSKTFSFSPRDNLVATFCPPEYFEKYSGDINAVDEICKSKGLMCTAWSYRIYKEARRIIQSL